MQRILRGKKLLVLLLLSLHLFLVGCANAINVLKSFLQNPHVLLQRLILCTEQIK